MIEILDSFMKNRYPRISYRVLGPNGIGHDVMFHITRDDYQMDFVIMLDDSDSIDSMQLYMDRMFWKFGKKFYQEIMNGFDLHAKREFIKSFRNK